MQYICRTSPVDFHPWFAVVACYLYVGDELLFLLRHPHKSEGGKWGMPGGKVDTGESLVDAMIREIKEETGIAVDASILTYTGVWYVRQKEKDFLKHEFVCQLADKPVVDLHPDEHADFAWVSCADAFALPLITGEDECLRSHMSTGGIPSSDLITDDEFV